MFSSLPRPKSLSSTVPSSSLLSFSAPPPAPCVLSQDCQSPPSYPLQCVQWGPPDFLMVLKIKSKSHLSGTPPPWTRLVMTTTSPPSSKLSMLIRHAFIRITRPLLWLPSLIYLSLDEIHLWNSSLCQDLDVRFLHPHLPFFSVV